MFVVLHCYLNDSPNFDDRQFVPALNWPASSEPHRQAVVAGGTAARQPQPLRINHRRRWPGPGWWPRNSASDAPGLGRL